MTIIFFETKIRFATKINKNQDLPFVLAQMNATGCISGQNKMIVFTRCSGILHAVGGV